MGGMEFQPTIAVDEKKDAKANAAWKVLQELGFLIYLLSVDFFSLL